MLWVCELEEEEECEPIEWQHTEIVPVVAVVVVVDVLLLLCKCMKHSDTVQNR